MSSSEFKLEEKPDVGCTSEFRTHHGRDAVGALAPILADAGLPPSSTFAMDPGYLAAGHEGDCPQATVAYQDGAPIGYMPFVVRGSSLAVRITPDRSIAIPYRQLLILGYQSARNCPSLLAERLLGSVLNASFGYDIGVASEIPLESSLADSVLWWQRNGSRAARVSHQVYDSFRIRIAASLDEYLEIRFNAKARYNIRREVRRFHAEFPGTRVRAFTDEGVVEEFLRDAEAVGKLSYQWSRGLPVVKATPAAANRLHYLAQRGVWRGYLLYADGQPCAYSNGMLHEGVYDYDVVGYDARYSSHSPGTVLLLAIIKDLSDSGAARELDFGAGPGAYKHHFATHRKQVMYASIYPPRLYTWLLKGAQSSSNALAAAVRALLRRGSSAPV